MLSRRTLNCSFSPRRPAHCAFAAASCCLRLAFSETRAPIFSPSSSLSACLRSRDRRADSRFDCFRRSFLSLVSSSWADRAQGVQR